MQEKRIPLAWSVRWRRIRSQAFPAAMFLVAIVASSWLWRERGRTAQSIGEVSAPRVNVTSPAMGMLVALPNQASGHWSVYDHVAVGDVIARVEVEESNTNKTVEIQAPISGTLVDVRSWPGQTVIPGQVIATIAADVGRHIVGYIPEESALNAKRGMAVTLQSRAAGAPRLTSKVEEVGAQIQKIPSHQRTNASSPQWGTPVRIKVPVNSTLQPGALVDLRFDGSGAL